jgi:tRNA threonylcarbamoyladenosine biosynthesis protein TsaE
MFLRVLSQSPRQTKTIARLLAKEILQEKRHHAQLILLSGPLGSGKTTFVQGFGRAVGVKKNISSPTFLLMRPYPAGGERTFWHVDCYRIKKPNQLLALGIRDVLGDAKNIVLVEWPEGIKNILPRRSTLVSFALGPTPAMRFISIRQLR